MRINQDGVRNPIGRDTVRAVSKLALTAMSLFFLLYLLSLMPGVDRLVPTTGIPAAAIAGAVVTVVLVGLLLHIASGLAALVAMLLDGPKAIVEHIASIVHWTVILAAVLVAHRGFEPAVDSIFDGGMWAYDLVFLALALPPLVIVAARLYVSLDPAADILADSVSGEMRGE